jgi:cellulose synthase/poly-beta-1,6-N-acetylglucosamine synthase-like glycosyltransferase
VFEPSSFTSNGHVEHPPGGSRDPRPAHTPTSAGRGLPAAPASRVTGPEFAVKSPERRGPLSVSVLACAYNEERNLAGFLDALLHSRGQSFTISNIVVVASGCTDTTPQILERYAHLDSKICPVYQAAREGKASAIQLGFPFTTGDVVLVENPDTIPGEDTLESLAQCFRESASDLVCCRPIPLARPGNVANSLSKVLWDLHDEVQRKSPKAGEGYAIRREKAPYHGATFDDDDVLLSFAIRSGALRAFYCPAAKIYLNSPSTIGEYARQRFRIARQMGRAAKDSRSLPSTWSPPAVLRATTNVMRKGRDSTRAVLAFWLAELSIRGLGMLTIAVLKGRDNTWNPIQSTKESVVAPGRR